MDNDPDEKRANRTSPPPGRQAAGREVSRRALDALGPHVAAVQRLADAAAARDSADSAVTAARDRAADLVARARIQAAETVRAAEDARRAALVAYRDVFAAALATGWTADQLDALGYDRVLLRPRRQRIRDVAGTAPTDAA